MKTTVLALAACLSVSGAGIAAAAATDPAQPTTVSPAVVPAKPAKGSPDEVVCKTYEVTGSRLDTKKRCMTRADWEVEQRAGADGLSTAQTNASYMAPEGH